MEIYQLRTFLSVVHFGHLTRAAEQLFISQPAVSKQIKALEEELGVALFERLPTGLKLTRVGRELMPFCERIVGDAKQLLEAAERFRGEVTGSIRLGTIIDPESIKLGSLLARMVELYPHIDIALHHRISGDIIRSVQSGDLDAGFYLGAVDNEAIEAVTLRTVRYVVISPRSLWDEIRDLTVDGLVRYPWIGPNARSSQHRLLTQLFESAGLPQPPKVVNVDQESSMIDLVRNGVGLCLMRQEVVEAHAARDGLAIWDKVELACPLSFVSLRARAKEVQISALRNAVLQQYIDN